VCVGGGFGVGWLSQLQPTKAERGERGGEGVDVVFLDGGMGGTIEQPRGRDDLGLNGPLKHGYHLTKKVQRQREVDTRTR